jgi:hypothetical protein
MSTIIMSREDRIRRYRRLTASTTDPGHQAPKLARGTNMINWRMLKITIKRNRARPIMNQHIMIKMTCNLMLDVPPMP